MDILDRMSGGMAAPNTVPVGVASGTIFGRDPMRVSLIVSAPPTNRVTLSWNKQAVLDAGINMYPATAPLVLSRVLHGPLLDGPITAISAVAAQSLDVVEGTLRK